MDATDVIEEHERSGRRFTAAGVESFVLDHGQGEPVVCLHGVPASAFLYGKLVRECAARGCAGLLFDLPGLGLAARPKDFDYTWTGLGRFAAAAVDRLGLQRLHLVIHDIGGPS
jgi:haloalkane dehalogenase